MLIFRYPVLVIDYLYSFQITFHLFKLSCEQKCPQTAFDKKYFTLTCIEYPDLHLTAVLRYFLRRP